MTVSLHTMSVEALAAYREETFEQYIGELMKAGRTRAEAEQNAAENQVRTFRDGVPINGNEVFSVVDGDDVVGVLWIGPRDDSSGLWWIYDIELGEEFRGRGLGRATMLAAEAAVRDRGGIELGLNVFGHNTRARTLYESLGYEPTSIQMRKAL